jgi:O-antigen/teichoic acid export membrane protein
MNNFLKINFNLIKDYLSAGLGTIFPAFFSLGSILMFSKTVGMEVFGSFVIIYSIVDLIDKVFGVSTWQAYQRFITKDNKKNLISNLFVIDVFFSFCSFFFSCLIIYLYSKFYFELNNYFYLISLLGLSRASDISIGILRAKGEYLKLSFLTTVGPLVRFIFTVIGFIYSYELNYFISLFFIDKVISLLLKTIYLIINKSSFSLKIKRLDGVYKYLINTYFDSSLRIIPRRLDIILLSLITTNSFIGLYQIIKDLSAMINYAYDPLYQVLYRNYKESGLKKSIYEFKKMTTFLIKISPLILFFINFIIICFLVIYYDYNVTDVFLISTLTVIPPVVGFMSLGIAPLISIWFDVKYLRIAQIYAVFTFLLILIFGFLFKNTTLIISAGIVYYLIWFLYTYIYVRKNE